MATRGSGPSCTPSSTRGRRGTSFPTTACRATRSTTPVLDFPGRKVYSHFPDRKVKEDDMTNPTQAEAQVALHGVAWAREQVIGQIGMPWWYWWGLAACWVGLGVMSDLGLSAWIVTAATVAVGAVHSAVFNRLLGGRAGSGVQVRRSVAGKHVEARVIGFLLALVALTVVTALLLDWD